MNRTALYILLVAVALLVATPAAAQTKKRGFSLGTETFLVLGGSATLDVKASAIEHSTELDDSSSFGYSLFGMFALSDMIDAGVVLHLLSDIEMADQEKVTTTIGSQTDINARARINLPTELVRTAVRAEAGASIFSINDDYKSSISSSDGLSDDTNPLGYNFGLGVEARYSILPVLGIGLALDYQYYNYQLFSGKDDSGADVVANSEFSNDLSGNRFKLALGLELGF